MDKNSDNLTYQRRRSHAVEVGNTPLGGDNPIRIQTMATVSTMDTKGAVDQAIRIIEAGSEYVRFTAQGEREAANLADIRRELDARGYHTPLVADIHFNPNAADVAALYVEKVRINPGNYIDGVEADAQEKIRKRFVPFLRLCREHKTAIRIGVNHGSLSDRIMSRFGDTPEGMVESCMEFLRICVAEDFRNVVISIKASNTVVMIRTVRLLVRTMEAERMAFPLHLGVTEAGEGEDGRIKSAVGIGTLLMDGIGDTIRVSLSEEPEAELPVARKLVEYARTSRFKVSDYGFKVSDYGFDWVNPERRRTRQVVLNCFHKNMTVVIGGDEPPTVIPCAFEPDDYVYNLKYNDLNDETIVRLKEDHNAVVILNSDRDNPVSEMKAFFHKLLHADCDVPVIIRRDYSETDVEMLQIKASVDFGALLIDGFGDGIMLCNEILSSDLNDIALSILQAARVRISKTEYISCPGCGRTLFNLQDTVRKVKAATRHLKGLKIAVMGCIVNGPGEMADADYGYVGAGRGRISLYKGKQCVIKNIPEDEAVTKLLEIIDGSKI